MSFYKGGSNKNLKSLLNIKYLWNSKKSWTVWCTDPRIISRRAAISFTATRRFYFTMVSTAAMASGVTTRCAWPGRGQFVTELMSFMNFLFNSYTCCSDRHASSYWTFIRRWISMGFHPFTTLFFFGACCKRDGRLYPTLAPSCCIPASYCHLSAILQTISIIAAKLQGNRAVFPMFKALLVFHLTLPCIPSTFPQEGLPWIALRWFSLRLSSETPTVLRFHHHSMLHKI
jgi:hypothetical protein